MENYSEILDRAFKWGQSRYPASSNYRHSALANSVAYLVTGGSGGYGGPSLREHLVSRALAGDGFVAGGLVFPDGRIARPGEWDFDRACLFAEPIVYGRQLPKNAALVAATEYCFDDDPEDLEELRLGK